MSSLIGDQALSADAQRDWLFDALEADSEGLVAEIVTTVRAEVPGYAIVDAAEHSEGVRVAQSVALRAARQGLVNLDRTELRRLIRVSRERNSQSVPLDDMVHGWHLAMRIVLERARALGREHRLSEQIVLDFIDAILLVTKEIHAAVAETLKRDQDNGASGLERRRAEFVLAAVQGALTPSALNEAAASLGLDPLRDHIVVRARPIAGGEIADLRRMFKLEPSGRAGMAAEFDGDLILIMSHVPPDFDGTAGVGDPMPLHRLAESFRLATRALSTAAAFRLTGARTIASLGLLTAIAGDADVGRTLESRYVDPVLLDAAGEDLIKSVRAYFAKGMHVGRAADELYIHPNTLRYRISRFEALTGSNLREQGTAFEAWWALEHHALDSPP